MREEPDQSVSDSWILNMATVILDNQSEYMNLANNNTKEFCLPGDWFVIIFFDMMFHTFARKSSGPGALALFMLPDRIFDFLHGENAKASWLSPGGI